MRQVDWKDHKTEDCTCYCCVSQIAHLPKYLFVCSRKGVDYLPSCGDRAAVQHPCLFTRLATARNCQRYLAKDAQTKTVRKLLRFFEMEMSAKSVGPFLRILDAS